MIERKNYFTIDEVEKITGVAKHTLRYWEKRINLIKPVRLPSKHRRYTRFDVETVEKIKKMLQEGYSLDGIRSILYSKKNKNTTDTQNQTDRYKKLLLDINKEIKEIINHL